jgi:cysteine-rich repeat protein
MLTFGIPVQAFEILSECQPVTSPECQSAEYLPFGVPQGRQPFWIVQPAFTRLGPFFLSNPTGELNMTVQLVVQVNVDLIAGSYIAFRGFPFGQRHMNSKTGNSPKVVAVSCFTTQAFAPGALWDNSDQSFTIVLAGTLKTHAAYTIRLDFRLEERLDNNLDPTQKLFIWADSLVKVGRKDSMIPKYTFRSALNVNFGNVAPSFQLLRRQVIVSENGLFASNIAKDISPGAFGIDSEVETRQELSFSVTWLAAAGQQQPEQQLPGQQAEKWRPIFRASQLPSISTGGELTFTLLLPPGVPPLREHQSGLFQLNVALHDNGGVADGGVDTSEPELIEVVVIGTPKAVRLVRSALYPRAIKVMFSVDEDVMKAQSIQAHGRVIYHIVQLRSWDVVRESLKNLREATIVFPTAQCWAENCCCSGPECCVWFPNLEVGEEYYPVVSACNSLVCGISQIGAVARVIDVPSQPTMLNIFRRSGSEIIALWADPEDLGDKTPYKNETDSDGVSIQLGVRLRVFTSIGFNGLGEAELAAMTNRGWIDHMLLTAESHPKIFQVGGKGAGISKYVSLIFFNVVGNSEPANMQFELDKLECEVHCGDGLRALSHESCDDGNTNNGDGCSSECTVEASYFCKEVTTPEFTCLPALYGKSMCWQPAFESVRIEASTSLAGASNQLLIYFVANFMILKSEDIQLRGLTGVPTPYAQYAEIRILESLGGIENLIETDALLNPIAFWNPSMGTLQFKLKKDVSAFTIVAFAFTVANPHHSQPAQTVYLDCIACCADAQYLLVTPAFQATVLKSDKIALLTPTYQDEYDGVWWHWLCRKMPCSGWRLLSPRARMMMLAGDICCRSIRLNLNSPQQVLLVYVRGG